MSSWGSRKVGSGLLVGRGRVVGLLAVASVAGVLWPASAGASTTTFSFTGGEQTYTVPAGVHGLSITAIGAPGGVQLHCPFNCGPGPGPTGLPPGRGAAVSGVVSVAPGQVLYVEVGGTGGVPAGGFNGGGEAGSALLDPLLGQGGGGGASDVRTVPMSAGAMSLNSRLIVAGGGGGSGFQAAAGGDAGQFGGVNGLASDAGGGATLTAGGAGGCDPVGLSVMGCGMAGSLGYGGNGGSATTTVQPQGQAGAGGGGGLYGGGGGAGVPCVSAAICPPGGVTGGGGGGSSLVPTETGTMQLASLTTAPSVQITPAPPPTCQNVTWRTQYRQAVTVQLNCSDFAAQSLTYAIVTAPAHGKVSGDVASGQVTYTPAAGFSGQDSFTYDASSTNGTASAVTVSIAVALRSVARAGPAHGSRTGVKIPVRCRVEGVGKGSDCEVKVTISANGVAVGETSSPSDACLACRQATVVIGAGETRVINIPLNRKGRDLLAARGKLPVSVVVTQTTSGTKSLVSRQRLVL